MFKDKLGVIVYIGKTIQPNRGFTTHLKKDWNNFTGSIEVANLSNEADIHILEMYLINIYKPENNTKDKAPTLPTIIMERPIFKHHLNVINGEKQ